MRLALSMALQEFKGAMVIVSHDRHMLKTVTDKLLLVDSGKALEFDGDLDDYAAWLQNRFRAEEAASKPTDQAAAAHTSAGRKDQRREAAEKRKQLQPLKKKIDKLEQEMNKLQQQQAALEAQLADPDIYSDANRHKLKQLVLDKSNLDAKLEEVEMEWMERSEEYDTAMAEN
jgi:ATP-binding cassette subfamily F protein 3